MRIALLVQRYGEEIRGGAELHCRLVAEHLADRHHVEVVTTCARDYVTWANDYPPGVDLLGGVPVWRFPVSRTRDPHRFGRLQERVFHRRHSNAEARAWMDEQGPYTPAMMRWIEAWRERFDYWICFSYRYWTTFEALRRLPDRGILVPTAEPDPAIAVPLFHPVIRGVRAIVYNSHEERRMILEHTGAEEVPGDVVGVGIVEPEGADPERFRRQRDIDGPFLLYVGRIDANKGCGQLFDYYRRACQRLAEAGRTPPRLVLAGHAVLDLPDDPGIVYLGAVDEQEKYDALAAATALVMPSFFESLSMVLLEAWALRRPVLVNGHCDVLEGQVTRARGGLHYKDGDEFAEALSLLLADERLRRAFGDSGHRYFLDNYRWPVIEDKYDRILDALARADGRALPEPAGGAGGRERSAGEPAPEEAKAGSPAARPGPAEETDAGSPAARPRPVEETDAGSPAARPRPAEKTDAGSPAGRPRPAEEPEHGASVPGEAAPAGREAP